MGLDAKKAVFGVSRDKARLKQVSSATETSQKTEILLVATLDNNTFQKKGITKALVSLRGCAGWSVPCCSQTPKTGFLASRPLILVTNHVLHKVSI